MRKRCEGRESHVCIFGKKGYAGSPKFIGVNFFELYYQFCTSKNNYYTFFVLFCKILVLCLKIGSLDSSQCN
jgi:hypothetical protein